MQPGSDTTTSAPSGQSGQRSVSLAALLRALGITGFLCFGVLTFGGIALLRHLANYSLHVLQTIPQSSERLIEILKLLTLALQLVVWIPLVPILLIAVFLPLRVAWIHGCVRWSVIIDEAEFAIKSTLFIIQLTWRQVLFLFVPVIGILLLLYQLTLAEQPREILLLFQAAAIGFGGAMLWQAAAPLCAAPIAMLTGCAPLAAVQECAMVIRGAHRVRILCGVVVVSSVTTALLLAITSYNPTPIELWIIFALAAVPYWILWIAVARTCLCATIEYIERLSALQQQALTYTEIEPGQQGIVSTLANGQPVTIQIQNLHVDPRR